MHQRTRRPSLFVTTGILLWCVCARERGALTHAAWPMLPIARALLSRHGWTIIENGTTLNEVDKQTSAALMCRRQSPGCYILNRAEPSGPTSAVSSRHLPALPPPVLPPCRRTSAARGTRTRGKEVRDQSRRPRTRCFPEMMRNQKLVSIVSARGGFLPRDDGHLAGSGPDEFLLPLFSIGLRGHRPSRLFRHIVRAFSCVAAAHSVIAGARVRVLRFTHFLQSFSLCVRVCVRAREALFASAHVLSLSCAPRSCTAALSFSFCKSSAFRVVHVQTSTSVVRF